MNRELAMKNNWTCDPRWKGIVRNYSSEDVLRIKGTVEVQHTLARMGAERLWILLQNSCVKALGALTGHQAVQQVKAGLPAIYCSGWQVAGDANLAGETYPDQSLYPANSVPSLVRRINKALKRADEIDCFRNKKETYWFAPIVADAEAGFGGVLNVFELMKEMIDAGAAAVHFEDQLSSAKKCGHMGGKVVVPTSEFVKKLIAARFAADVADIPTIVIARTDANSASLLANDIDPRDRLFVTGKRTEEGFLRFRGGIDAAIQRGLAYAPYADMLWCETSKPDLSEAQAFADGVHSKYPGKLLAYNCSPSFNWKKYLDDQTIAKFQQELCEMGYKFQFITLAGFHSLNNSMFRLAKNYATEGMSAYVRLQQEEFAAKEQGYGATEHQAFVGTNYFDEITQIIFEGVSSTLAMEGSTEKEQF